MKGKHIKPYDEQFKRQAVELLFQSQRPLKTLARELGVDDSTLREWRQKYRASVTTSSPKRLTRKELQAKVRDLENEVAYLQRQREILKKAVSICSEAPTGDMP